MANNLYEAVGKNAKNDGFSQFMQEVKNLQQTFKGDPRQEVQKLMNSGQLSQAQFNQYAQMANQIMALMPK